MIVLLVLPLKSKARASLANWLSKRLSSTALSAWSSSVGLLLSFLAISAMLEMRSLSAHAFSQASAAKLAQSQRDLYLSVSVLLMYFLVLRFAADLVEYHMALLNNDVLTRQSKQTAAAYAVLLDQNNELEKELGRVRKVSPVGKEGSSVQVKGVVNLKKQVEKLESELKASKELRGQQESELKQLRRKVEAFQLQLEDYEFMFGDQLKKDK